MSTLFRHILKLIERIMVRVDLITIRVLLHHDRDNLLFAGHHFHLLLLLGSVGSLLLLSSHGKCWFVENFGMLLILI